LLRKRLEILQVVPYFFPAWAYGGIPRVAYELSRELVRKGHDVTVYTTDVLDRHSRCGEAGKEVVVDGIRVRYFRNLSNALAYDYQLFLPTGLCGVLRRSIPDFDILHFHGHRHLLNNAVHFHAMKSGKPFVLSGHGTVVRIERRVWAKRIFDKVVGDRILRDARRLVAVSEHEVGQYREMGVEKERVEVIYNGIDVDAYRALPEKGGFRERYSLADRKIVLYLGKITPRKGLDFLVRAFSGLRGGDAVLVIAGNDMGFRDKVEAVIREKGVGDRVLFTGLLTGEEKLSAYRDADVLVYPAIHEIFGLVPFEAIMCGTPVIVTDDCGCGEIIGREGIGYTVRYGDVIGLKDKLEEVLADRADSSEKVERGREFIRENLSWERIGAEYERLYHECCVK
jgi:glycosyltransferase involved in cell wall biosynthesis